MKMPKAVKKVGPGPKAGGGPVPGVKGVKKVVKKKAVGAAAVPPPVAVAEEEEVQKKKREKKNNFLKLTENARLLLHLWPRRL